MFDGAGVPSCDDCTPTPLGGVNMNRKIPVYRTVTRYFFKNSTGL